MHQGLEIRATFNDMPILVADSDHMHLLAKYRGMDSLCGFACLPGCREHGWMDLQLPPGTKVEVRPVMLADDYPDDDDLDEDEDSGEVKTLSWHYGPTKDNPDPGRMWHYGCGREVLIFDDGYICECGAQDDDDE